MPIWCGAAGAPASASSHVVDRSVTVLSYSSCDTAPARGAASSIETSLSPSVFSLALLFERTRLWCGRVIALSAACSGGGGGGGVWGGSLPNTSS